MIIFFKNCILSLFFFKVLKIEYKYSYDLLIRAKKNLPIFWSGAEAFTDIEKKLLSKNKKKYFKEDSWNVVKEHYSNFMKKAKNKTFINWMTYVDLKLRLPELLLMRIDKMTMACSLEGRVPFLDYKLVEKMIDIPSSIKLKNNLKYILKNV